MRAASVLAPGSHESPEPWRGRSETDLCGETRIVLGPEDDLLSFDAKMEPVVLTVDADIVERPLAQNHRSGTDEEALVLEVDHDV